MTTRGILGPHVYQDVPFHTHEFNEISGELIISEAQITTLSASKITAGTIDAEVIKLGTTGGNGVLESVNYVAGVSGFRFDGTGFAELGDATLRGSITVADGTGSVFIDDGSWDVNFAQIQLNRGFTNPGYMGVHGVNASVEIRAPWDTTVSEAATLFLYGDQGGAAIGDAILWAGNSGQAKVLANGSGITVDGVTNDVDFAGHWQIELSDGDISGSFIPTTDSLYNLGSTGQRWANGWIDALTLTTTLTLDSAARVNSNLLPQTDSTHDLGSTGLRWAEVWTDQLTVTTDVASDLIPDTDSTKDLGSTSVRWAEIWADTIDTDALTVSGSGDIDGAAVEWKTWSPAYDGITVGNGTAVAEYWRVGDMVVAHFYLAFGTTTSLGSTHARLTPPVSQETTGGGGAVRGWGRYLESGVSHYGAAPYLQDSSTIQLGVWNAAGTYTTMVAVTSTVPHTWGDGDIIDIYYLYQAA